MHKRIFSKEQEDQIRKAFDAMNQELGLDKLDDEQGLRDIMARVQQLDLFPEELEQARNEQYDRAWIRYIDREEARSNEQ